MTPEDFDQFDYRSGNKTIRPNVLCLFRMERARADNTRGARNFNIVSANVSQACKMRTKKRNS